MYINTLALVVFNEIFYEVNDMDFVNEYVTDEKLIKEFNLDDLWNHYNPLARRQPERRLSGSQLCQYYWTTNHSHNIWLMNVGMVYSQDNEISRTGYPEPTGEYIFIFHCDNMKYDVRLKRGPRTSLNYKSNPYVIIWELISPNQNEEQIPVRIIPMLKNALITFGQDGVRRQIDNTVVEFDF